MKKLFIACLILLCTILCVSASDSQANIPTIVEEGTSLPANTTVDIVNVKTVVNVKPGDNADTVNNIITNQNNKQTNAGTAVSDDLKKALGSSSKLPDNALITGKGFYEIELKNATDGSITGAGLVFTTKIPEISSNTKEVGIIHYSSVRGFEYIKADSFDKTNKTAKFTLADTSPIAFVIANEAPATSGGSSSSSSNNSTVSKPVVNTSVR